LTFENRNIIEILSFIQFVFVTAKTQHTTHELQNTITICVDDVSMWMRSKRLQLNTAKTEILWSITGRRSHQLPQSPLRVGTDEVIPTSVVRDLGI